MGGCEGEGPTGREGLGRQLLGRAVRGLCLSGRREGGRGALLWLPGCPGVHGAACWGGFGSAFFSPQAMSIITSTAIRSLFPDRFGPEISVSWSKLGLAVS